MLRSPRKKRILLAQQIAGLGGFIVLCSRPDAYFATSFPVLRPWTHANNLERTHSLGNLHLHQHGRQANVLGEQRRQAVGGVRGQFALQRPQQQEYGRLSRLVRGQWRLRLAVISPTEVGEFFRWVGNHHGFACVTIHLGSAHPRQGVRHSRG